MTDALAAQVRGMEFDSQRSAAAWMIRQGRRLLESNVPISEHISRRDNNATFEMGFQLIAIGRRIAMGYEMEVFTDAIYKAHVRATRPASRSNDAGVRE